MSTNEYKRLQNKSLLCSRSPSGLKRVAFLSPSKAEPTTKADVLDDRGSKGKLRHYNF